MSWTFYTHVGFPPRIQSQYPINRVTGKYKNVMHLFTQSVSYQYSYLCVQCALLSSCVSLCDVFGFSIVLPPWNIIILRKWGRRQRVLEDCYHLLILKFTHRVLSETWNFYTLYTFAKLQMYILLPCLLDAFKNGPESLGLFFWYLSLGSSW